MDPVDPDVKPPRLIYIGDPMCSWCWGFAPVVESLSEDTSVEVIVGGLRPGPAAEPLGRLAGFLGREWPTIADRTGQPFDVTVLADLGPEWLYDTEPAAQAVVAMRSIRSDLALSWFSRLQRAFYAQRIDITDPTNYASLLDGFPVDVDEFEEALAAPDLKRATWEDFNSARRLGVTGFPTLLERRAGGLALVSAGYSEEAEIRAALSL